MREIKFRAWDIDKKEMSDSFDLWNLACCDLYLFNPTDKPDSPFKPQSGKRLEILQYTGLSDKQGKEIYEGDIVRYRCLVCVNKDLEQTYDEVIGVVEYQGSCFTAGMKQGYYSNYLLYELDKYEVIGNIYEHSYLLDTSG